MFISKPHTSSKSRVHGIPHDSKFRNTSTAEKQKTASLRKKEKLFLPKTSGSKATHTPSGAGLLKTSGFLYEKT
jgi:hypothetical protein